VSAWEEIWEAGPYYERFSELIEKADHYVAIVGWQLDSRLSLPVPGTTARETLKDKLLRLCEARPELRIFLLMWDHSYFYVLERELWQTRVWDELHPRIHLVFDNRHPFGGAHHEKLCLIDGRVALCGGIDLCGDRWDSPSHLAWDPRRSLDWKAERHGPYHDLAVQVGGEICGEIHNHIASRWKMLSTIPFPPSPAPAALGRPVYLSRTVGPIEATPLVREVEFLYRELIFSAEDHLLIEGQYYWSRELNDMLIAKMLEESQRPRERPFEIFLTLAHLERIRSWTRHMAVYELKLLRRLEEVAAYTGTRLSVASPWTRTDRGVRPIYIHSKLIIADDRYLSLGSANLATRALRLDTEVNLTIEATHPADQAHLRRLSREMRRHWAPHQLRPFHPLLALRHLRHSVGLLKRYHWERFFDPRLPWLYPMKRYLQRKARYHSSFITLSAATLWIILTFLVLIASSQPGRPASLFAAALSAVWFLPIPFLAVTLGAALTLGGGTSALIVIWSYWLSALTAYSLTRAFPTLFEPWARSNRSAIIDSHLGQRSFQGLVRLLFNPRIPVRSKLLWQGVYCMPLPWFALCNGLLVPAALYLICRWLPPGLQGLTLSLSIAISIATTTGKTAASAFANKGANRNTKRGRRHDGTEASQSPQLQYPQGIQHEQPSLHPGKNPRSHSARPSRLGIPARGPRPTRRPSAEG